MVATVLADDDLTRHQLRHQREMLRQHAHLAFHPRKSDHFHVL
jgi:hypothetical protein